MARLRHVASGEEHFLSARHLIGRAPTCQLRIDDPGISGFHAELFWDGEHWFIQDLGSRNGTALGRDVLEKGQQLTLERGAEVVLAGHVRLELVDDSPPHLLAVAADGTVRVAEGPLLSLPDDEDPAVTLFQDLDGQWMVETDTETRPLQAHDSVVVRDQAWQVLSPRAVAETYETSSPDLLRHCVLRFEVSRDGEFVQSSLVRDGQAAPIPLEPRTHQLLLLELARERLSDASQPDLPVPEHGWVYRDVLNERLGVPDARVHLWIHRARKQLSAAGIRDAAAIIERRASTAQLRLGTSRVEIDDR